MMRRFLKASYQRRARRVQMFHLETEQKMEIKTYLQTLIYFFIFLVILASQFLANYQSHLKVSGYQTNFNFRQDNPSKYKLYFFNPDFIY